MTKEQSITLCSFIERFEKGTPLYQLNMKQLRAPYDYEQAIHDFIDYWITNGWIDMVYQSMKETFTSWSVFSFTDHIY